MFQFCSLYSGSSGNSLLLETENTKILVDAGESSKKIVSSLEEMNIDVTDIDAVLVTHEHSDHIKGLGTLSQKFHIPVYANSQTWSAMSNVSSKIIIENQKEFKIEEKFDIGDITISPFSIPHDAANPCGFNFYHNNQKATVATDLGHIDASLIKKLEESLFVLLESNYDFNILQCSRYPYSLKQRIAGPNGHLSNDNAAKVIAYLHSTGLTSAMLGHLSKENNFPELAYKTVIDELCSGHFDENSLQLNVASRYHASEKIDIESLENSHVTY